MDDPAANSSSDDDDSSSESRHVDDPVREAIATINDGNGVDIDGIYEFVKARHDLMPNYRDVLEVELSKRVSHNELEKVDNLYRIIDVSSEPATESNSEEPVSVSHPPANTSSDLPTSSSGETHDDDMVLDALSILNYGNGADIDEIYEYIQDNYHQAPDDRNMLEDELNERVYQNELEMVDTLYRIIDVSSEPATEAESEEPVAVPDPAENTSSDTPSCSSSGETHAGDMALKAIRTLNDGNGADIDEIFEYVKFQEGYQLEPEHRNMLEEYLDFIVSDNELEKVDNRYKIVNVTSENTHETTETESKSVADSDDQKDPATSSSDYALPYGDMPEAMVMEAISTMDYGIGVDIDEIYEYIENRYKIPPDYMKILEDELNKRVSENEVEKGEYGYKILDITAENMDEAQSQAPAVADPAKSSSSSSTDFSTSTGNTPYFDPVIEAISTIDDGNGVNIDGIYQFIQEKYERCVLRPNYRKLLEKGLKRRVSQCKLEKVDETHYKILDITPEKLDEISEDAAKALAVSDQKDLEAKEASEAADRAKKVLEENKLVLQVAKEALDRCTKGGD